ncbi:hypothetical protein [Bradyrhizobium sp.]|jgi:hypothetical protein|uniref:hypothetical protein n=1 Tax=Bradyrhizobium sp. TaxID=376 RepID=UPI003BBAE1D2
MATLVQTFSRLSSGTNAGTEALKVIALLCGAVLAVSIVFATYGLDLSPGFF